MLLGLYRKTVRSRPGGRLAALGVERRLRDWFTYLTALRHRNKAHGPVTRADLLPGYRALVLPFALHERRDDT